MFNINDIPELCKRLPFGTIDFEDLIESIFVYNTIEDISKWAEENVILPSTESDKSSYVNFKLTPYLYDIINSFSNKDVREITVIKPAQAGATMAMLVLLLYIIENMPSNTLFVSADKEQTSSMSLDRFVPLFMESKLYEKHFGNAKSNDFTKTTYRFKNMLLHWAWATSSVQLSSKPKKYVFCDEIDKWPTKLRKEADPVSLVLQRLKTFKDSKAYFASTPTHRHGYISKLFNKSNKCHYYCPCPNCKFEIKPIFSDIKIPPEFKKCESALLLEHSPCYYECPNCKYHITESEKKNWINNGFWKADKPHIKHHHGYAITGIISPFNNFSKIMYEFKEATQDVTKESLKNFFNSIMGEFFEENVKSFNFNNSNIVKQLKKGIVPDNSAFLICGIDKQGDRVYYSVYSFNFGYTVTLVDYGVLIDEEDIELNLINKTYTNSDNNKVYNINYFGMDTGFKPYPVYRLNINYKNFIPIKGYSRTVINNNYKFKDVENYPGAVLLSIKTEFYKDLIYDTFGPENKIQFHMETEDEFFKQINAEQKVPDKSGKSYIYDLKPGTRDNHFLDCMVYAFSVADTLGFFRKSEYRKELTKHIETINKIKEIKESKEYKERKSLKQLENKLTIDPTYNNEFYNF